MADNSDLQRQIQNLSDEKLVEILKNASDYQPEAISYAQNELSHRGGLDALNASMISARHQQEHEEEARRKAYATQPLFLHIPVSRLILMSIVSFSVYEVYWIYKNWRYVKERDNLDIRPFWRGWFGIFYCHSLLRRIHEDKEARALQVPSFSPGGLATGWVVLMIISNVLSRAPSIVASIIAAIIPSFLCLVPVQNYVNSVSELRQPGQPYYRWSSGHIVCLVFGIVIWVLLLIRLGAE